jgi:hypothetical protein
MRKKAAGVHHPGCSTPGMRELVMNAISAQLVVLARIGLLIALLFLASGSAFAEPDALDRQEVPTFVLERTELVRAAPNPE